MGFNKLGPDAAQAYASALGGLKVMGGYVSEMNQLVIQIVMALFELLKRDPQYDPNLELKQFLHKLREDLKRQESDYNYIPQTPAQRAGTTPEERLVKPKQKRKEPENDFDNKPLI